MLVLIPEGRVTHEEDVEDHATGPDVDGLAIGLLLQHLGAEVAGGAGEACNTVRSFILFELGFLNTEILVAPKRLAFFLLYMAARRCYFNSKLELEHSKRWNKILCQKLPLNNIY